MNKGEKFLKLYNKGYTYAEIAQKHKIPESTVSMHIHNYRKSKGLKAYGRRSAQYSGQATKHRIAVQKEREAQRAADIKQCRKVGNVTICPPRAAYGYGQDYLIRALGK